MNRQYLDIEKNKKYYELVKSRLGGNIKLEKENLLCEMQFYKDFGSVLESGKSKASALHETVLFGGYKNFTDQYEPVEHSPGEFSFINDIVKCRKGVDSYSVQVPKIIEEETYIGKEELEQVEGCPHKIDTTNFNNSKDLSIKTHWTQTSIKRLNHKIEKYVIDKCLVGATSLDNASNKSALCLIEEGIGTIKGKFNISPNVIVFHLNEFYHIQKLNLKGKDFCPIVRSRIGLPTLFGIPIVTSTSISEDIFMLLENRDLLFLYYKHSELGDGYIETQIIKTAKEAKEFIALNSWIGLNITRPDSIIKGKFRKGK